MNHFVYSTYSLISFTHLLMEEEKEDEVVEDPENAVMVLLLAIFYALTPAPTPHLHLMSL